MSTQHSNLDAFWMPFTANRQYKSAPRVLVGAKGMHYTTEDGRKILDGTAGLWCTNAGHARTEITEAVSKQIQQLDFAPTFQMGHPLPFELAQKLVQHTPDGLDHVFFTNSGSESADTALKIALAYHRAKGNAHKTRLVGREKGYHGTNFGGISVGGLGNNRKAFGSLLSGVDHLKHAWVAGSEFTKGQPDHGEELADELNNMIALHGDTIAAVIIEPVVGSGGVWMPPKGYLERLRKITKENDIILIFDEVITGYGRIGKAFAAERFGVTPDIITSAKGLTNGAIPMGAVFVSGEIHNAFMQGPEEVIELFHGYTYSGHPVAAAAAIATLEVYEKENLFEKAIALESYWQDALHSLKEFDVVKDIRNLGLVGAVEFKSSAKMGERGFKVFNECYWKHDALVRCTGDIIAMSPPLIISESDIDQLMHSMRSAIKSLY
ncbi:omega amino acid--pyruvate aminotransferase [Oleiphilus sp. HI0071]|nr:MULTISPECIES: aspartate aminotransferase family protein [unclassified Oleiphilus]KZY68082.1 omega amino acid--pyruvate aminotransferase [Oleiphilus sp. HI0065]KZY78413.1 omega amino acid--pyruvate aminotransferase [Oleiphilus sp. HI0071]KZY97177.1 omega amino acid--pyruvate aminotransferase [Oleiphilus sp. HI0073]KZZ51668.1 omega amino acid--pyruvate aminotransferase [Oleiphilus sp. HI0122]KZZ54839.1 omega amino acid--pyruvate aminotransferase [Oleiphilus sp. HI0118]KZZ80011.1 omega amino 